MTWSRYPFIRIKCANNHSLIIIYTYYHENNSNIYIRNYYYYYYYCYRYFYYHYYDSISIVITIIILMIAIISISITFQRSSMNSTKLILPSPFLSISSRVSITVMSRMYQDSWKMKNKIFWCKLTTIQCIPLSLPSCFDKLIWLEMWEINCSEHQYFIASHGIRYVMF